MYFTNQYVQMEALFITKEKQNLENGQSHERTKTKCYISISLPKKSRNSLLEFINSNQLRKSLSPFVGVSYMKSCSATALYLWPIYSVVISLFSLHHCLFFPTPFPFRIFSLHFITLSQWCNHWSSLHMIK